MSLSTYAQQSLTPPNKTKSENLLFEKQSYIDVLLQLCRELKDSLDGSIYVGDSISQKQFDDEINMECKYRYLDSLMIKDDKIQELRDSISLMHYIIKSKSR